VIADLREAMGDDGSATALDIAGVFRIADEGDGLESIGVAFEPSFAFAPTAGQDDVRSPAYVRIGDAEGSGTEAQRLFNAMTRATEDVSQRGVERTSPGGSLSCRHFMSRYECQIRGIRGVAPPGGGSDASTLVSTDLDVIEDIGRAVDPSMSAKGLAIPNVLTATIGKGIFRLTMAGRVGVTAPPEDAPPARFHLGAEFGGLATASQPMSPEMTAAKAVYDAMGDAVEAVDPSTQTTARTTRGGRVTCSTHPLEFTGAAYFCTVEGVRSLDP
jgi:hypothetical protein